MTKTRKITDERMVVEFRGVKFEVSSKAWNSVSVQKACTAPDTAHDFFSALDKICLGHFDDYIFKMPDENGEVDEEFGAGKETLAEFVKAVAEASGKN